MFLEIDLEGHGPRIESFIRGKGDQGKRGPSKEEMHKKKYRNFDFG